MPCYSLAYAAGFTVLAASVEALEPACSPACLETTVGHYFRSPMLLAGRTSCGSSVSMLWLPNRDATTMRNNRSITYSAPSKSAKSSSSFANEGDLNRYGQVAPPRPTAVFP